MIKKEYIQQLVEDFLTDTDKFIVKISVGQENKIHIYIDGDSDVSIDDCVAISRYIESKIDRDVEDYDLSVSSSGVGEPLVHNRQFKNKVNKPIEVLLKEGSKFKAILLGTKDNRMTFGREIKTKGKKSKTFKTGEAETISLDDVKYVKEIIII
ncbi:MAG: ribosome assembly cofactor RimP [Bacteroidales bacterium]|jgi:ribosome maturation factor RimP|nr:ribosome assembly cofactor RimP [Bacteroidales bacterium]